MKKRLLDTIGVADVRELLRIELEGLPPSVNRIYRNAQANVRYKTTATLEYQNYVIEKLREVYTKAPYTGAVQVFIKLLVKDKRKWDIDNRLKVLLDCLQLAEVIKDDCQVDEILLLRQREQSENKTLLLLRAK